VRFIRHVPLPRTDCKQCPWNLGRVDLVDPRSGTVLGARLSSDKTANADGRRTFVEPDASDVPPAQGSCQAGELPPLLKRILQEYAATGLPPAYLPKTPPSQTGGAGS
jgi:hypothetical protein